MTKIIGLTGGIGSGKTTVAKIFESLGIPVYTADYEAKKIMKLPKVITKLKMLFGELIFENNILNTEKLAKIVFNNHEQLLQLNSIVHPLVKTHFKNWVKENKNHNLVIKESALLFETESNLDCFKIISVIAPLELRIQRVIKRDKTNYNSVLKRINNQISDEARSAKSDYIINNLDIVSTKNQVNIIFNKLTNY